MNKLFYIVTLCAAVLAAGTAFAGRFSVDYLKADQVKKLFSGKTVTGSDLEKGSAFTRYYDPNGTVLNDAQGYKSTGKWRVEGSGAHCVTWDNEGEEQCLHIKDNGDGTYTKIRNKNIKKIPVVEYQGFKDGNIFAQAGQPVNTADFNQSSANSSSQATGEMLQAVSNQDVDRLEKAIASGANVNATFEKYRTALFLAVEKNNIEIIKKLITAGANVDAQDSKGDTPLIVATRNKSIQALQVLLQNGATAKIKNKSGQDALSIAKYNKATQLAEILVENSDGPTALGLFIDIKNRNITEEQFLQAAVKAFEGRNWHVDKAENNEVAGTYTRNDDRVFKSRMIYQPDVLLIKFDSAMGYPKPNYLLALRTLFFSLIENRAPQVTE